MALIKSLATVLKADPGNDLMLRNYLSRLEVELDPRLSPPEYRLAEAKYLAAELLHREGILSAEVLAQHRDPWQWWQNEMTERRASADRLTATLQAEWDQVDALPHDQKIARLEAELAALNQKRLGA